MYIGNSKKKNKFMLTAT